MSGAWVYMLECADGHYYVGSHRGEFLENRINEHNAGKNKRAYTYTRRPVKLVWSEYFQRITDAIAMERRVKGWRRSKKEALIEGNWGEIQRLSKGE